MGKTKNFFLMLKQGIKGVFKFKIQFIIIIILAFIATFILSVSLSTQLRMQDSYDKIVKPVQKFSYSGSVQINSSANSNTDPFILATELDNSGSTDLKVVEDGKDGKANVLRETSSFNFVLYNHDGVYKDASGAPIDTFLTRGTEDFKNNHKSTNFTNNDGTQEVYGAQELYWDWMKSLYQDLKKISDGDDEKLKEMSQTKYSPIGLFTREHKNWFKDLVDFNGDNVSDKTDSDGSVWVHGFAFGKNDVENKDVFNNTAVALAQLAGWTNDVAKSFGITTNDDAIKFLFDVNKDTAYTTNPVINTDNSKNNKLVFAKGGNSVDEAIKESGLRGITNPFVDTNKNDSFASEAISNWDNLKKLSINPGIDQDWRTNDLYTNMRIDTDFYAKAMDVGAVNQIIDANSADNHSLSYESLFRVHNKISADATGFNYKIRRETTYFDANNQLKFRAITLNRHENYNFTILRGRMPAGNGEMAISEQFAKKNNLTVGSYFAIGDAQILISGLATDALSYMPAQDLSDPIPNPKVSAFVYATSATIDQINGGTRISDSSDDALTENLSYFLFDNKRQESTVVQRMNAFQALFSNQKDALATNYAVAQAYYKDGNKDDLAGTSHISLDEFTKSGFRFSWTLQPLVFKVYDAITYSVAGIVAIIAMISLIVCVKKTIDFNSKQIGILKALGEKPTSISVNYLSYSMIITFIVVPVAWLVGMVLQIPFGNMFLTYFSVQPETMLFDWISFLISFGILGLLSGAVSFLSAWLLTNKPVLQVLTSSVKWGRLRLIDWFKNHPFKRANFSTRFSLTLTSSGSKQIVLMSVVMFVASLLMSAILAIPSIVITVNDSYYKSVKYANKYDEIPMTGNAPLSKNSISYWNGQDYLEQNMIGGDKALQLDSSSARYGYYDDPEAYTATVSNSNTMSQYLYDAEKNTVSDGQLYILQHQQDLLNVVATMFGNNFFTHLGVSFSIGEIDKLYGILLHSLDKVFDDGNKAQGYSDEMKLNEARNLSGWLTTAIPRIIGTIVNTNNSSGSENGSSDNSTDQTWKQKVMNVIFSVVPSYVKAYIKQSDSRLDQYAIAFQNDIYIPGQETLTTTVDHNGSEVAGKTQPMSLTGLDQYQNSILIDDDEKADAYMPQDIKDQIYNVLNSPMKDDKLDPQQDINWHGMKIYDSNSKVLTIPVIPNQQAASAYDLAKGNTMSWDNLVQNIQLTVSGKQIDLPRAAWVYNDSDWANYVLNADKEKALQDNGIIDQYISNPGLPNAHLSYDSENPNNDWIYDKASNGNYYLNPARIDNNKLTYNNEFSNSSSTDTYGKATNGVHDEGGHLIINNSDYSQKNNDWLTLRDRAMMFKDFMYDPKTDRPIGTYARPYYQYKNMQLIVPEGWVKKEKLLNPSGVVNEKNQQWWSEISTQDVPQSVKDGFHKLALNESNGLDWSKATESKWLVINPYDINYHEPWLQNKQKQPLANLIDGPSYWYFNALKGDSQLHMKSDESLLASLANLGAPSGLTIKLKSVGTIDSYNDKLVVVDSDIANMFALYPLNRHYEYNYQTFNRNKEVQPGVVDKDGISSQFSRFEFNVDPVKDPDGYKNFINNQWDKDKSAKAAEAAKAKDLWNLSYGPYKQQISGGIMNYAPHAFYNGKLSNIEEALNYTSQISFTKSPRWAQAAINLGDNVGGGTPSIILNSTLLSTTKELISQIATLAFAIGALLMVAIIITAALVTMLTGDIYIAQYRRFMVLLRALGYSKTQVFTYTFGTVTILSLIAWVCGTILAWGLIYIGVGIMWNAGFAIPMGITWWPIVVSFFVMFLSYFGSLYVSSSSARTANPSTILTATAE